MSRFIRPICLFLLLSSTAVAFDRMPLTGPLADYVSAKDDSYAWIKRSLRGPCRALSILLRNQLPVLLLFRCTLFQSARDET